MHVPTVQHLWQISLLLRADLTRYFGSNKHPNSHHVPWSKQCEAGWTEQKTADSWLQIRKKWNESRIHTNRNFNIAKYNRPIHTLLMPLSRHITSQGAYYITHGNHYQSHNTTNKNQQMYTYQAAAAALLPTILSIPTTNQGKIKSDELDGVCGEGQESSREIHLEIRWHPPREICCCARPTHQICHLLSARKNVR
jgi:hypothetical protein